MKISEDWSWDAPAERVFEMLLDPKFQEAKCAATGAIDYTVSVQEQGAVQLIETRREMSTDGLPDNVSRFVGNTLKIIEIQQWGAAGEDGSRTADLEVSLSGLPINYVGQIRLTPAGDTTSMAVEGDLRARIPLFGGKVESAAAPGISEGVQIEAQTGKAYLAG